MDKLSEGNDRVPFFDLRTPFSVGVLTPQSPADQAGLEMNDKIVAIDDQPVSYFQEFKSYLENKKDEKVNVKVNRGGEIKELKPMKVSSEGTVGFAVVPELETAHEEFTFGESISIGTEKAFNVVWTNIRAFGKIFKGEVSASKSLSGPIGIAKIFGGEWIWAKFWGICGFLSMVLAFMNLLPIPALDGGHVVFLSYEMISGRKPNDKFLENAQKIGMVLLLGIMAFAIINDIYKWLAF